jgi:hypothetical protein
MGDGDHDSFLLAVALVWIFAVSASMRPTDVMISNVPRKLLNLIVLLLTLTSCSSADSLEEIVGLDVGYTGAEYVRRGSKSKEDDKMDEYLKEYEHRKREKAYLAKANIESRKGLLAPIPASSVHIGSLHGHSYHGRKVITQDMIDSPDVSRSSHASAKNIESASGATSGARSRSRESAASAERSLRRLNSSASGATSGARSRSRESAASAEISLRRMNSSASGASAAKSGITEHSSHV